METGVDQVEWSKMENHYGSFLDYRAAQRRLAAKFARPHGLMLHALIFVTTMTAIWAYGIAWKLWYYQNNYTLPVLVGAVWSVLLVVHALLHYRRSPARVERRDLAVEEEMRALIEKHADDDESLFAMHRGLEADLARQGRWSLALVAFAAVNAISWVVSAFSIGSSWPFQMTLPIAVIVIGGISIFMSWQQQRQMGRGDWFTRLPMRHIAAYLFGVVSLALAGTYRMINYWDVDTVIKGWSLVLMLHIVGMVVGWPLLQRVLPGERLAKRKPPARLVLADDGEVLEIAEQDPELAAN